MGQHETNDVGRDAHNPGRDGHGGRPWHPRRAAARLGLQVRVRARAALAWRWWRLNLLVKMKRRLRESAHPLNPFARDEQEHYQSIAFFHVRAGKAE